MKKIHKSCIILIVFFFSCSKENKKHEILFFETIAIQYNEHVWKDTYRKNANLFYSAKIETTCVDSLRDIFIITPLDTIKMTKRFYMGNFHLRDKTYQIAYSYTDIPNKHEDLNSFYNHNLHFITNSKIQLVFSHTKKEIVYDTEFSKICFFLNDEEIFLPKDLAKLKGRANEKYHFILPPAPPLYKK